MYSQGMSFYNYNIKFSNHILKHKYQIVTTTFPTINTPLNHYRNRTKYFSKPFYS